MLPKTKKYIRKDYVSVTYALPKSREETPPALRCAQSFAVHAVSQVVDSYYFQPDIENPHELLKRPSGGLRHLG
jgi:hypothetical protein